MAVEKEVDELIKYLGSIRVTSIRCHDYLDMRVRRIKQWGFWPVKLVDFATIQWDKQ